jgi:hyaluronan synthase
MSIRENVQKNIRYYELDKKRWVVRYLILATFGSILSLKFYLTIFVIDPFVGIYSIITTSVTFGFFFLSYVKYKDPYYKTKFLNSAINKPLVSIVIPVKNEEDFIKTCVESCINSTYSNKEIIIVDDGSTDRTGAILDEMSRQGKIKVIHNPQSTGKKRAVEIGTDLCSGDFYVFMDSDCSMASDAVEKTMQIFMSDETIGAITGHGRVRGAANGSTLTKIQDTWMDGNFRIAKAAEGSFSTLSCCSGSFSAFRKLAIQKFINSWVHDKFLGREFKFATDRRLTAYVLGAKAVTIESGKLVENSGYWKMKYSSRVRVLIGMPLDMKSFIRQQIRWRKSFIRSIFSTGSVLWKRPFPIALLLYLQLGLKMLRPYIVLKALLFLPLGGDYLTSIFYFASVLFTSMMYGIEFRLRNPDSKQWLYRPLVNVLNIFVFSWLLLYTLVTIRKTDWR